MSAPEPPASDRSSLRAETIALNASPGLTREAVCRLASDPGHWLGKEIDASLARTLGVSVAALEQAHRVAETAECLAGREEQRAADLGASIVLARDRGYPELLLDLELAPPLLYVAGTLDPRPAISIVGSRRAHPWALEIARGWSRRLAQRGLQIVSGFARGVDEEAHRGALVGGGPTLAVLGCGLDVDYPRGRRKLRAALTRNGALVSELPLGAPPLRHHFPIRNRLIAALGDLTLVVQAAERSGSLITARLALELGRDVHAVPGRPTDRQSRGGNALIRDGAGVALDADELIEALPLHRRPEALTPQPDDRAGSSPLAENALDRRVLDELRDRSDGASPEALSRSLGTRVETVLASLVGLELEGRVRRVAGGRFLARL